MNLRELVASSLQATDLSQSPLAEAAIDRVGGLAFTDPLGAELWRFMCYQAEAFPRLMELLTERAARAVTTNPMRTRICGACIREFTDASCRTCGGTGYLMATATATKRLCPTCEGSRQRRYSDLWRARQLRVDVDTYQRWARRYGYVFGILTDADLTTARQLAEQLERRPARRRFRARIHRSPQHQAAGP